MRAERRGVRHCGRYTPGKLLVRSAAGWVAGFLVSIGLGVPPAVAQKKPVMATCRRAVLKGEVRAGAGFEAPVTHELDLALVPTSTGWVLQVVRGGEPRAFHDLAELATLPYQSVSPLLISTDWGFRAQDAVGWSPRRFRFAASPAAAQTLRTAFDAVLRGDGRSSASAARLASEQPEGLLTIEDARLVPGAADQARMAAAVSTHFQSIPHTVDPGTGASPLGRLEELRFRVLLDLPRGMEAARGVPVESFPCLR